MTALRRGVALSTSILVGIGLIVSPVAAQATPTIPSGPVETQPAPLPASKAALIAGPTLIPQATGRAAKQAPSGPTFQADCPPTIKCTVVPAAFADNSGDGTDYGNYDTANRPVDMKINGILIHDTEGDLASVLEHFQDSKAYAATQYVIDNVTCTVYQMVQNKDMPWHAGNWWFNMHTIGIEHVGHAALGGTEYTDCLYRTSAQLVKYLTAKYNIPRDRGHIIGHDNVPAVKNSQVAGMHTDPGPFWNWQLYMRLIGAPVLPTGGLNSGFVTVAPTWPLSKLPVTGCSAGVSNGCVPAGLQPTNFVYLHTAPRADAPLFADPILGQGTTDIGNNAARLFYGQTFATSGPPVPDAGGVWIQVWVNGGNGWFYSPWNAWSAFPASAQSVTPAPGKNAALVYGRPRPELAEYPADLLNSPTGFWIKSLAPVAPLGYALQAGQRYTVIDRNPPNDHYYCWSIDGDRTRFPYDHTVFPGKDRFIEIQLGNRVAFVKAADVVIS